VAQRVGTAGRRCRW